ncbi:MAG: hypothetical protein TREMPRED_000143 [Tremellales sp. Tagirdzhanova-0007]|nr:MAG: hypothetical protein TREMPRED_000143 [Tremellales sp. Tagirdzhanova-0007]
MSSTASESASGGSSINNFNGGTPQTGDFVPSVIFAAALAISVPLLIWRIFSKKNGSKININAMIFFLTRLASVILRAYMAKRSYGEGTLIAEVILISISYLFLINTLIDLWQRHLESSANHRDANSDPAQYQGDDDDDTLPAHSSHGNNGKSVIRFIAMFFRLLLVTAMAAAIAAGILLRNKVNPNEERNLIPDLLKASYVLSLASTILTVIAKLVTHITHHRSLKRTLLLSAYSVPLIIIGIYRIVQVFKPSEMATKRELAAFWVCTVFFEFVAYSIVLAISIPKWFARAAHKHGYENNKDGAGKGDKMRAHGANGHMGNGNGVTHGNGSSYGNGNGYA